MGLGGGVRRSRGPYAGGVQEGRGRPGSGVQLTVRLPEELQGRVRADRTGSGMRSISATFRMTEPTDTQAMEWMTATMHHALRWGGSLPTPA